MSQVEYMVADKPLVCPAAKRGPGIRLGEGERVRADQVRESYLAQVRDGGKYSTIAHVEVEGEPDEETTSDAFDPATHKVDDVIAYLDALEGDGAEDEIERVKEAEGQNVKPPHRPSARITDYARAGAT